MSNKSFTASILAFIFSFNKEPHLKNVVTVYFILIDSIKLLRNYGVFYVFTKSSTL